MKDNFYILQNIFLKNWKIQHETIQNVCQLCSIENFAKFITVVITDNFSNFFKIFTKMKLTDVFYIFFLPLPIFQKNLLQIKKVILHERIDL